MKQISILSIIYLFASCSSSVLGSSNFYNALLMKSDKEIARGFWRSAFCSM